MTTAEAYAAELLAAPDEGPTWRAIEKAAISRRRRDDDVRFNFGDGSALVSCASGWDLAADWDRCDCGFCWRGDKGTQPKCPARRTEAE